MDYFSRSSLRTSREGHQCQFVGTKPVFLQTGDAIGCVPPPWDVDLVDGVAPIRTAKAKENGEATDTRGGHVFRGLAWFHRFHTTWTPTILVLDSKGTERHRIEGYLPKDEFEAQLEMGLARVAFEEKRWKDAERIYGEVVDKYPQTSSAPDARYWRAVGHYKGTNDHSVLGQAAKELQENAPNSVWAKKALPWLAH